jgi:hypothetical protein
MSIIMASNISEWWQWLTSLDRTFAFLLALPFLVALAGLVSLCFERRINHS